MGAHVRVTAAILVPLMAFGSSCAGGSRDLRLRFDGEEGVVALLPAGPVDLTDAEIDLGFRTLAQDPQLIALFRQPEGSSLHLLPVAYLPGDAFVPGYRQLCADRGRQADCLGLLGDGAFNTDDRQRVAMSIAWHSVLSGVALELGRTVDPQRVYAMVTTAMVGFMAMLAFPDPITKILLAALTLAAVAYMGWDTIFSIRNGWKALQASCESATSFADLRAAGERFGTIIGEHVGRIIVMLVVAAMGASLGTFSARLAGLPGFARAAQLFQARCGFSFGAVTASGVQAVTITGSSAVIALTPGVAWAATSAMDVGGGGSEPPQAAPVRFKNMDAYRKAMGSAGPGKQWHHIVEQNPGNLAKFGPERLHSTENVMPLDEKVHARISGFYSSKQPFTGGLTVRQWLSTQSWEAQREFGLTMIKRLIEAGP